MGNQYIMRNGITFQKNFKWFVIVTGSCFSGAGFGIITRACLSNKVVSEVVDLCVSSTGVVATKDWIPNSVGWCVPISTIPVRSKLVEIYFEIMWYLEMLIDLQLRDGWFAAFMCTYSFRKVSSCHPFHCQCLFCCNTHDYVIYGGNIQRGQHWSRLFPCRLHLFSCLELSYIVPRSTQKSFLDIQYSSYHPQQLQIHLMLQNKKYSSLDVCIHTVQ